MTTSDGGSSTQTSGEPTAGPSTTSIETSSEATTDETVGVTDDGPTSASSTEPSTSTGSPFVEPVDDHFEPEQCTTWEEQCPEGQKCMPYADDGGNSWNSQKCVDITGDGMLGEPCTVVGNFVSGMDDCAQGFICFHVDSQTQMGTCQPFCKGSPEQAYCEQEGYFCQQDGGGVLNLCLESCDPLVQDCSQGQGCYPLYQFVCVPPGAPEDTGYEGDPCQFFNGCQPGFACIQGDYVPNCDSFACCTPFCDLNNPDCQDPEKQCAAVFEMPAMGEEHFGACMLPG